jgi:hypothetical protein
MSTLVAVAVLLVAACSLREPTTADRTPRQIAAAARHTGLIGCTARIIWIAVVTSLLCLACSARGAALIAREAADVALVLGLALAEAGGVRASLPRAEVA